MPPMDDDALFFEGPAALEAWLEEHGATSDGIWVRMAKKHTGVSSLDWEGAVEVVLCFGWIDGTRRRIDDESFVQRLTPRRPRSVWSKANREKVAVLSAAGRMRPAGLREVEAAKADGRWERAYDGMARATVPEDLAAALAAADLTEVFAALPAQSRYTILHRIQTLRTQTGRARAIARWVARLAEGEEPEPPR